MDLSGAEQWQLGLATAGTILVFCSLGLALWSNKIAIEALNVSRDTSRRQLRAYVHPIKAEIEMNDNGQIVASLTFKNSGQTPAYGFECRSTLTFSHNLNAPESPRH